MRPSKFDDEQIRQAIRQVEAGTPLVAMCRTLGITRTTFYRWRAKHGDRGAMRSGGVRALRDENAQLKQLVADLYLSQQALRASLAKHLKPARSITVRKG